MAKLCIEFGEIVSKEIIPAQPERIYKGQTTPARAEMYKIVTLSGADYEKENGYISPTVVNHFVDKTTFDIMPCRSKVKVSYDFGVGSNGGEYKSAKAIELAQK